MSYSKHNFKAGDVIRAAHLNAMDAQIEELSNRANNSGSNTCEDCLTADSLKTINGQSLVGSGDIVISGGGNGTVGPQGPQGEQGPKGEDGANGVTFTPSVDSAGNLSWTNNGGLTNPSTVNIKGPKGDAGSGGSSSGGSGAYSEVNHGTSDTTFILTPNTFHVWEEVTSLELAFGDETSGVANEYLFQFTSGSTPTTLSLPDDIKWTNELSIEPNMIYQVSILKGLGSVMCWKVEASIIFPITLEMGNNGENGVSLYNYFADTYGQATAGTAITEEIYNNGFGTSFLVSTIEYGHYSGYIGYWLNDYRAGSISWVLQSDGYMIRVIPAEPELL